MRILHLLPFSFLGGPESQILQLAQAADRAGHQVQLILLSHAQVAPEEISRMVKATTQTRIEVSAWTSPGMRTWLSTRQRLESFVQEKKIDLVVSSGYVADLLSDQLSFLPVKRWSYFHGWTSQSLKIRFYEWCDRRALRRMDKVICVSAHQRGKLLGLKIHADVLHNALPTPRPGRPRSDLNPHFNVPNDGPILITLGRLSPEKNWALAMQAFALLLREQPKARWLWLGDGPDKAAAVQAARASDLQGRFHLLGHQAAAAQWLSAADLVVLTSKTEGLPIFLIEAMAYGRPIVTTAVGGIPEILSDGISAKFVRPDQPDELAQALQDLLSFPEKANQLGTAAQDFYRKNLTTQVQADAWLALLGATAAATDIKANKI